MNDQLDPEKYPSFAVPRPPLEQEVATPFVEYLIRGIATLPALFGFAALFGAVVWLFVARFDAVDRYLAATRDAENRHDNEAVMLAYRRLSELVPGQDHFIFELARAYDRAGEGERAEELIGKITPDKAPGYVSARLWRAEKRLTAKPPSEADILDAEFQIAKSLEIVPDHRGVRRFACQFCLERGRLTEAIEHVDYLEPSDAPELRLQIAVQLSELGQANAAARFVDLIEPVYTQRLEIDPRDVTARAHLALCKSIQGRNNEAVAVVEKSAATQESPMLEQVMGNVLFAWAMNVPSEPSSEQPTRDDLFRRAVAAWHRAEPPDFVRIGKAQRLAGRLEEAEQALAKASVAADPHLLLERARLQQAQGRNDEAKATAEQARTAFHTAVTASPKSEPLRIEAAEAELFLGNLDGAVGLVEAGMTNGKEETLRRAASRLLLEMYDAGTPSADAVERRKMVELLKRSHHYDPWNDPMVERWDTQRRRWSNEPEPVENIWNDLTAEGRPPLHVLTMLGARAKKANELDRALSLLGEAYRRDPENIAVAGDLAWVLVHHSSPDLSRALDILSRAIAASQASPDFLMARGEIYAKLKNWQSAFRDLEAAGPALKGRADYHLLFATVYDGLKDPQHAAEQRELAQQANR